MPEEKWALEYSLEAERVLERIEPVTARRIVKTVRQLTVLDDPTVRCKALTGPWSGHWRIRVGDWRVILRINRGRMTILAIQIGHRSHLY